MFHRIAERLRSDQGFGLVEIVVSMFMMALLAVAFLPLLIQGLQTSHRTTTLATATQLVNERMQLAQSSGPVCTNVATLAVSEEFTDPRGVVIRVVTDVGTCPAGVGTVDVVATATRLDTSEQLAVAETKVFVQ